MREDDFFLIAGLVLLTAMVLSLTVAITQSVYGANARAVGYCTALGGVVLNNDSCDVDGKVVRIEIPE